MITHRLKSINCFVGINRASSFNTVLANQIITIALCRFLVLIVNVIFYISLRVIKETVSRTTLVKCVFSNIFHYNEIVIKNTFDYRYTFACTICFAGTGSNRISHFTGDYHLEYKSTLRRFIRSFPIPASEQVW